MINYKNKFSALLLSLCVLFFTETSFASGGPYYTGVAKPAGKCFRATKKNNALRKGETCFISVGFYISSFAAGDKLTQDVDLGGDASKPITYWLERRTAPNGRWTRFQTIHEFDNNQVTEYIKMFTEKTYEYRVAFNLYGLDYYPEFYSENFTIYVRK